jgi:hypothetical protein
MAEQPLRKRQVVGSNPTGSSTTDSRRPPLTYPNVVAEFVASGSVFEAPSHQTRLRHRQGVARSLIRDITRASPRRMCRLHRHPSSRAGSGWPRQHSCRGPHALASRMSTHLRLHAGPTDLYRQKAIQSQPGPASKLVGQLWESCAREMLSFIGFGAASADDRRVVPKR